MAMQIRSINNFSKTIISKTIQITPICIDWHILPIKARIKYKIFHLTSKALKYGKQSNLAGCFEFWPVTTINVRSNNDNC